MTYVVWVGNSDKNDGTSHVILQDGTEVWMGIPLQLNAEQRKYMEAQGQIFEESSAEEAKAQAPTQTDEQPVGSDVVGTAPTFGESQTDQPSGGSGSGKSDKK